MGGRNLVDINFAPTVMQPVSKFVYQPIPEYIAWFQSADERLRSHDILKKSRRRNNAILLSRFPFRWQIQQARRINLQRIGF
jgi:hypothetical protein